MDIPDFDQKPKRIKDLRTGDRTSFYIRPKKLLGEDIACDLHPAPIFNLNIINKKGRQEGSSILYSPDQIYNYLSPSERQDSAISELPIFVRNDPNDSSITIYGFCSSLSPTGFWEVRIGGKELFLEFSTNNLLIICPRPFRLSDLVAVETNADFIKWTQLQGRITIIAPPDGEGSVDPIISIIGNRDIADPPVLLIAEAEGNPGVYEFLSIDTSVRERVPRPTGATAPAPNPLLSPDCRLIPLSGTTATWVYPFYVPIQFHLQRNQSGLWETIAVASQPVSFTFEFGVSYRVLAIHQRLDTVTITSSCVMRAPLFKAIHRDIQRVSGNSGILLSRQFQVTSQIIEASNTLPFTSGNSGVMRSRQFQVRSLTQDAYDLAPFASGNSGAILSRQYALSGIIAG